MCFHSRMTLIGWAALCAGVLGLTPANPVVGQSDAPKPAQAPSEDAPWRRVLTGADAKRVEELEKQLNELEAAGKFAEAQKPARDIWAMRSRVQGAAHWQTADAKRRLRSLEQRAALSPDAQAELVQADKHFAEAKALNEKVQYAEAERLHRQ